jgi:hypothetical protein
VIQADCTVEGHFLGDGTCNQGEACCGSVKCFLLLTLEEILASFYLRADHDW